MTSSQELLHDGRLADALAAQVQSVKAHPTGADERFLLFVLLCFSGDLERAKIHLDALVTAESSARGGASVYHEVLAAEYERNQVFGGHGSPTLAPGSPTAAGRPA